MNGISLGWEVAEGEKFESLFLILQTVDKTDLLDVHVLSLGR